MTQERLPTAHPETLPEQYEVAAANAEKYLTSGGNRDLADREVLRVQCLVDSNALLACAGYLRQIRDALVEDNADIERMKDLLSQRDSLGTLFSGSRDEQT